jgi:hypothetical protein
MIAVGAAGLGGVACCARITSPRSGRARIRSRYRSSASSRAGSTGRTASGLIHPCSQFSHAMTTFAQASGITAIKAARRCSAKSSSNGLRSSVVPPPALSLPSLPSSSFLFRHASSRSRFPPPVLPRRLGGHPHESVATEDAHIRLHHRRRYVSESVICAAFSNSTQVELPAMSSPIVSRRMVLFRSWSSRLATSG